MIFIQNRWLNMINFYMFRAGQKTWISGPNKRTSHFPFKSDLHCDVMIRLTYRKLCAFSLARCVNPTFTNQSKIKEKKEEHLVVMYIIIIWVSGLEYQCSNQLTSWNILIIFLEASSNFRYDLKYSKAINHKICNVTPL